MKKKIFMRCIIGAPIGIAISTIITIIISVAIGNGNYYPVVSELIRDCGNEINAVLLQAVCSLLYGAAWAGASVIWEKENWSILRQTITHLIICSAATFPVAYFMRWMDHSMMSILIYFAIFIGIYLCIWLSQYFAIKKRLEQINSKMQENNTHSN